MGENGQEAWAELSKRAKVSFRAKMLAGIVFLVPGVVTLLVLRTLFQWLDGFAQPLIKELFETESDIPGLGIVLTLVAIWLAGVFASNVLGKRLIGKGDTLLTRAPLIGSIYSPVKQFIETLVSSGEKESYNRVVLAEYPSDGRWILGFCTGEIELNEDGQIGKCVFVPTSPNPATGWTVIFPPEKVRATDLSVEDAMRLIVSAGMVIPDSLKTLGNYGLPDEVFNQFQSGVPPVSPEQRHQT